MRAPSTRRKNTIKRTPTLGDIDEKEREDDDGNALPLVAPPASPASSDLPLTPYSRLWKKPNHGMSSASTPTIPSSPNQLEGRSVKGQIRSVGLTEITKRCAHAFPVGMTHREFVDRYWEPLAALGISEGSNQERVEQTRTAMGLGDHDVVLGQDKVHLLLHSAVVVSENFRRLSFRTRPSRGSRARFCGPILTRILRIKPTAFSCGPRRSFPWGI